MLIAHLLCARNYAMCARCLMAKGNHRKIAGAFPSREGVPSGKSHGSSLHD